MMIAIAGPYSAPTAETRAANLEALNRAALEVWRRGHVPVIGVNSALPIAVLLPEEERYGAIMTISLAIVDTCDAILMIGSSPGADRERDLFVLSGRQVYDRIEQIPSSNSAPEAE